MHGGLVMTYVREVRGAPLFDPDRTPRLCHLFRVEVDDGQQHFSRSGKVYVAVALVEDYREVGPDHELSSAQLDDVVTALLAEIEKRCP